MNIVAMRMEGQYARLLNRLLQRFRITPMADGNPEQVGALVRLYWAELLLFGYLPSANRYRGTFAMMRDLECDPLLAAMPIAVAIGVGKGTEFDDELALSPAWASRILPIDARDFNSPYLEGFLRGHCARHAESLNARRDVDLPGSTDDVSVNFPWESPEM